MFVDQFLIKAPEVESRKYDFKCDIWSLGCVLFEICTLTFAIYGDDRKAVSNNVRNGIINDTLDANHILHDLIKLRFYVKSFFQRE